MPDDTPKFAVRIKRNNEVQINSKIIDAPDVPTFDLTQLNLKQLAENLRQVLDKPRPSTIWFKKRGVKKAELDVEHQRLVLDQISNLRSINSELVNLQADLFFSQDMLQAIISDRTADIKRKMELFAKEHQVRIHGLNATIKSADLDLEAKELSNLNTKADINLKTAQTEESKAKAYFIKYVLESIDIASMPQTLQTYIISTIFSPNGTQFNDFDMQEQIKQFVVKTTEANALKAGAEAEDRMNEVDFKRWKNERTKKKDTD
jgi:hypothetical protein